MKRSKVKVPNNFNTSTLSLFGDRTQSLFPLTIKSEHHIPSKFQIRANISLDASLANVLLKASIPTSIVALYKNIRTYEY